MTETDLQTVSERENERQEVGREGRRETKRGGRETDKTEREREGGGVEKAIEKQRYRHTERMRDKIN